jgi:hypothetical protein
LRKLGVSGAALLLGLGACSEKSDVRAKLEDGAVYPMTITCPAGKECALTVKTSPAIAIGVGDCPSPALAEESTGKAVAYRCSEGAPWNVLRLRGGDRFMVDCNQPLGNDAKADWSKLKPFATSAMKLLDCNRGAAKPWLDLSRAITDESGADAATGFVVGSTLHTSEGMGNPALAYPDGWIDSFDALDAAGQERVRKETCPALANATTPSLLYVRAVRRCPLDDGATVTAAFDAFKSGLAAERSDFVGSERRHDPNATFSDLNPPEIALMLEAMVAIKTRSKEMAETACASIATLSRKEDAFRVSLAATVLANTKTHCAAVEARGPLWPCGLVGPAKSKIDAQIDHFATGVVPPILTTANESLFAAMTIDGKYPQAWLDQQAEGGTGSFCP